MKGKENILADETQASKSQRRRDALEVKALASTLIKLSPARLGRVPLEDDVRAAIMEAREIRSNVARKRQMQYAAKLLRRIDPEPILFALEGFETEARQLTGRQHRGEYANDRITRTGDIEHFARAGRQMQWRFITHQQGHTSLTAGNQQGL